MKMIHSKLTLCLLLGCWLSITEAAPAADLGSRPPFPVDQATFKPISERSEQVWQAHLRAVSQEASIQLPGCLPFRLSAKGPRRGSILLFHGFTACPQQFWGLAPQLAAAGYDVFAPLSPGHGHRAVEGPKGIADQMQEMPADDNYIQYRTFANQMSDLVRDDSQRKMTGGVSVGATLAMSAMVQNPWLYDRAFLAAPLFEVVRPQNHLVPAINFLLGTQQGDWGPGCEGERAGGRAGYCQFLFGHIRATQRLGHETLAQLATVPTRIQLTGVENDHTADTSAMGEAVRTLPFAKGCLYAGGANHSMLSVYDVPDEPKFWLPNLERQLLRFVSESVNFDVIEPAVEAGLPRCKPD